MKHRFAIFIIGISCLLSACASKTANQPNDAAKAHYGWGLDFARQGDFYQAILDFRMAIRNAPTWAEPYYQLGIAYANERNLDEAISAWEQAIFLNPNKIDAHYNLARAYAVQNERASSIASLQKAIALDKRVIEAAKTESHFDKIRSSPEFQQLLSGFE